MLFLMLISIGQKHKFLGGLLDYFISSRRRAVELKTLADHSLFIETSLLPVNHSFVSTKEVFSYIYAWF